MVYKKGSYEFKCDTKQQEDKAFYSYVVTIYNYASCYDYSS